MYGTKYFDENFLGKSQIMGNAQYYWLVDSGRPVFRPHIQLTDGLPKQPFSAVLSQWVVLVVVTSLLMES